MTVSELVLDKLLETERDVLEVEFVVRKKLLLNESDIYGDEFEMVFDDGTVERVEVVDCVMDSAENTMCIGGERDRIGKYYTVHLRDTVC